MSDPPTPYTTRMDSTFTDTHAYRMRDQTTVAAIRNNSRAATRLAANGPPNGRSGILIPFRVNASIQHSLPDGVEGTPHGMRSAFPNWAVPVGSMSRSRVR